MTDSRGASEVVGFVLLVGLTMLVVGTVLVVGTPSLDRAEGEVARQHSELVASDFHDSVVYASDGRGGSASVDLGNALATTYEDRAWLRVTRDGSTVVNETLGTVVFGSDSDDHVAYQGGGLFRVDGNGTPPLRDPALSYRRGTLSLDVLSVRGDVSSTGTLRVAGNDTRTVFPEPNGNASTTNPVDSEPFTITIHSEYYRSWGEYIASETGATPFYDHANQRVSATLGPGREPDAVTAGVMSSAPTSTLVLTGGFSTDSYDSSIGPYSSSAGEGRVVTSGDVRVEGGAEIDGDLLAGGNVSLTGGSRLVGSVRADGDLDVDGGSEAVATTDGGWIDGDLFVDWGSRFDGTARYEGTLTDPGNNVDDPAQQSVSVNVDVPSSVEDYVEDTVDAAKTANDNADTASISGNQLDCTADQDGDGNAECYLTAGTYYLDSVHLGTDRELVFAPNGGTITFAVDGDVTLEGDAAVRVEGDGRVDMHVTGDFRQAGGATVTNPDDDATRMWLYLTPSSTADLDGGGRFVGVVYGPGDQAADPGAHIEPSVPIYGGLVGDIEFVGDGVPVHYDSALQSVEPIPLSRYRTDGGVPLDRYTATLDYFYLRTAELNVSS